MKTSLVVVLVFATSIATRVWTDQQTTVYAAAAVSAEQQPTEPARDQYLPIDKLPPSERMPSAPFVIAAYAIVWVIAMYYLWSIWRRTGRLENDMQALARRQKDASR